MQVYVILSLFIVTANARPQADLSSEWKPITTEPRAQRFRYNNQIHTNYYNRAYIPIHTYTHNYNNRKQNRFYSYRKVQTKQKEQSKDVLTDKDKVILNKFLSFNIQNLNNFSKPIKLGNKTKSWPDTDIQTSDDVTNYNLYTNPPKPVVHNIFTKVSENPVSSNNNNWFEIKMKPIKPARPIPDAILLSVSTLNSTKVDKKPLLSNTTLIVPHSVPIEVDKSPFQVNIPPNTIQLGHTVVISPEYTASEGEEPPASEGEEPSDPCPDIILTTNTIYNKEVCPDLEIIVNNHINSNTNIFTDSPVETNSVVPITTEAVLADETLQSAAEEELEDLEEPLAQDVIGETALSEDESPSSSSNIPQLPNLPSLPQNDNNNNNNEGGGLLQSALNVLSFFNPFNYPFLNLVVAPLALLLTGTLGLTTFFIPWALFPTIFLSRNTKRTNDKTITRPDGWFWHTKYKTWTNLNQLHKNKSSYNTLANFILKSIVDFGKKYTTVHKSWKRRKK